MTETRAFQNALNAAVTGVTVVTTKTRGTMFGATVSAMCHVSDEPPTLLVAIHRGDPLARAITESRAFAVNVLADHQAPLAEAFKGKQPTFAVKHWWPFGRLPLLQGAAATFECRVDRTHVNGTHLLVIGTVTRSKRGHTRPLAYTRRGYTAPLAA
jgi:flavin reductase (DIM6/NTAB) family NADH-FMN oxidoreductase RutF